MIHTPTVGFSFNWRMYGFEILLPLFIQINMGKEKGSYRWIFSRTINVLRSIGVEPCQ